MIKLDKVDKYNSELEALGITFRAFGRWTREKETNLMFKCVEGHEFSANKYRMRKGLVKCPSCAGGMRRRNHEGYENDLLAIESPLFPIEEFVGTDKKIKHECVEGHIVNVLPSSVLQGSGCVVCAGFLAYTNETFMAELHRRGLFKARLGEDLHGIKYKTKFICNSCEHEWKTLPAEILKGTGCPSCAIFGFNRGEAAYLYYVKLSNGVKTYYKIGVTNKDPKYRFKNTTLAVEFLKIQWFERGANAELEERKILVQFKDFLVKDKEFLPQGGYTELFSEDVMKLDNSS